MAGEKRQTSRAAGLGTIVKHLPAYLPGTNCQATASGGASEEIAAKYIKANGYPKKIVAFIAGLNAPAEKKMGHAGAIVSKGFGTAESKMKHLDEAGVINRLKPLPQVVVP